MTTSLRKSLGWHGAAATMLAAALLLSAAPAAWAAPGYDGTIRLDDGGPNGIMLKKIEAAWAQAAASGAKRPPAPPISGTHPTVIILVESATVPFQYPTASLWTTRLANIGAQWAEASGGTFGLSAAAETSGTANDGVIGPVTVTALNTSSDISGGNSLTLAVQTIQAANPFINFSSFDTDFSGDVEPDELHILMYIAGDENSYYASALPRTWAHESWGEPNIDWNGSTSYSPASDSDGVDIMSYCMCGSEFNGGVMATMGQMTHELGHDIGLPDVYDADGTGSGGDWQGLGGHCLMAGGSWGGSSGDSPVHINGFFKELLGWANVTTLTAPGDQSVSLTAANNDVLRVEVSGSDECFIVENRQQSGYETGLPGATGGVMVFHCDGDILTDNNMRMQNNVNQNPSDPGIKLEEADGDDQLGGSAYAVGTDADYFREGNNTTFDAASNPNSNLKNASASGVSITNVSASGATMTLDVGTPAAEAESEEAESEEAESEEGEWVCENVPGANTPTVWQITGGDLLLSVPCPVAEASAYAWSHDGTPLANGGGISGAGGRALQITEVAVADSGVYSCTYDDGSKAPATFTSTVSVVDELPVAGAGAIALLAGLLAFGVAAARRGRAE